MSNMFACGINAGTIDSNCTYVKDGKQVNLLIDNWSKSFYSIVCFKTNENILVGEIAINFMKKLYNTTVYGMKRLIGKKINDPGVIDDRSHLPFGIDGDEDENVVINITIDGKTTKYSPERIISFILNKMSESIEKNIKIKKEQMKNTVIAVPSCFNEIQRRKMIEAFRFSNFNVIQVINETTSAALVYRNNYIKDNTKKTILVYDFGGGKLECSIIEVGMDKIKVLASEADDHLGGEDLTNNLVTYFINKIKDDSGFDISDNVKLIVNLKKACNKAKEELSSNVEGYIDCDFLDENGIENVMTVNKFIEINKDIFNKTMEIVRNTLYKSRISKDSIDEIVLVGGSSKIPHIQELLKKEFPIVTINNMFNNNETVSLGCSILSNDLCNGTKIPYFIDENNNNFISTPVIYEGPDKPSPHPSNPEPYPDIPNPIVMKKMKELKKYEEESEEYDNDYSDEEVDFYMK